MKNSQKPVIPGYRQFSQFFRQRSVFGHLTFGAGLLVFLLAVGTCTFPGADFSAYTGVNLIPGKQFTVAATSPDAGWTPDETAANYAAATDMWYEPVSSAAGVNESADSFAGYTSSALLRAGLPALSDGTAPPIFRLETKNLFINGDFENGAISANDGGTPNRTYVSKSTAIRLATTTGVTAYDLNGSWMQLNLSSIDSVSIPFFPNVSDHLSNPDAAFTYSFSFEFVLSSDPTKYISVDNGDFANGGSSPNASALAISNNPPQKDYRFPFSVFRDGSNLLDESSLVTTTSGDKQDIVLNPQVGTSHLNNGAISPAAMQGSIDNIQIVRAVFADAVRINIPWTDSSRPILQRGGTYTVKLWVRRDTTSTYAYPPYPATRNPWNQLNRFDADFVSISLHPYTNATLTSTSPVGSVVTVSRAMADRATVEGWINYADWNEWTQISASFDSRLVLNDQNTTGYALQLTISATNMGNPSLRSPGSILIANPTLYWNPN